MKRIAGNCSGVAGFFEEIPVLIIVLVGLFVFLATFAHSYGAYVATQKIISKHDLGREFTDEVRMWEGLLDDYENTEGVFSFSKMTNSNFTRSFVEEFNPSSLRFQYNITIHDVSAYSNKVDTFAETQQFPVEKIDSIVINTPVVVIVSENERHAALLLITIWGWK